MKPIVLLIKTMGSFVLLVGRIVQLSFENIYLKYILGVNKITPNLAVLSETGRFLMYIFSYFYYSLEYEIRV